MVSAGIDNDIKIWDLRKNAVVTDIQGHSDTVTGMKLSPDGAYVLTNSMDNTLRIWVKLNVFITFLLENHLENYYDLK